MLEFGRILVFKTLANYFVSIFFHSPILSCEQTSKFYGKNFLALVFISIDFINAFLTIEEFHSDGVKLPL